MVFVIETSFSTKMIRKEKFSGIQYKFKVNGTMQPGWGSIPDESMCEVKTPFSHSEYMNSPRILRCQKDIAIYSGCEISPLFSISFFIRSNVTFLFRRGEKS